MRITADCTRQTGVLMAVTFWNKIGHNRQYIYCILPPIAPDGEIIFFQNLGQFAQNLGKKIISRQNNITRRALNKPGKSSSIMILFKLNIEISQQNRYIVLA